MGDALASMLEARSVAVVGDTPTPGSFGEQMMVQLLGGGFSGAVYPVNPKYDELFGLRCLPSLDDVPEPVDLAVLGVSNAMLEAQLAAAAAAGARSAVMFASAYEEPEEGRQPLTERLAALARQAGMALCGPNGMGFVNVERRLRACGFHEPQELRAGGITFVSHSGSAFSAMLHNDRGLAFNIVVSSGLESVTTMSDYLAYALELESTRILALFMETVRHPEGFRDGLRRAAERDVPVVAMKVGRAPRAREMVEAHSGALAGEDGAYEALFDAHGVLRVRTMDEMADTLELLAAGRRAPRGGLAAIHDSGGERAHLIDAAEEAEVDFACISEETRGRLVEALDPGLPAVNPLDAWGTGRNAEVQFVACMHALLDDPDTAALAFCVDLTSELIPDAGYAHVANAVFARTNKPVAVLSNMRSAIDARDAAFVRAAGMPVLEGTDTGLAAFRHLFAYRDFRARSPAEPGPSVAAEVRRRWTARLSSSVPMAEVEARALLTDYGLNVVAAEPAGSMEEALGAAERIGWPVAVKTAAPGVTHKSDAGGVMLSLPGPASLRQAYREMSGRLGPEVLVASMAGPGVELALGVVRDEQFGPMVMVGAGGLLVEVLRDRRFALPPVDAAGARRMLDRLSIRPLLEGVRGAPPADLAAVAAAVARLSVLAEDLGELVDAIDVNPVMAGPEGCLAVDALVIPRTRATK